MMGMGQSQQLQAKAIMTPELHQSVHILNLSSYELSSYLQEQTAENPLLELELPHTYEAGVSYKAKFHSEAADPFRRVATKQETLEESLLGQLRLCGISNELYPIAAYLAGNLDEGGYLGISVSDTCNILLKPEALVHAALDYVQTLDPAGVGARNLRECLLIQISRDPSAPPHAFELVERCFSFFVQGKLQAISMDLGLSITEIKSIGEYIRSLNPKPGASFNNVEPHYVIPDAIVSKEQNELVIRLTDAATPRLYINNEYEAYIRQRNDEAASFLKERRKSAFWLIRCLQQRKSTLIRVIRAIFEEQALFLERGVQGLKPLKINTIAEKLGIHMSTVSRAVSNKYIRISDEVFELKYFFTKGLQTDVNGKISIGHIKAKIAQLIAQENKLKTLSDQNIVDELAKLGIRIARRTVAKYREGMHIASSSLRKNI